MAKNRFTILETIRDGQQTRVLKAEQPSLNRIVLLKMLHKHLVTDANLVRRFEREARACAMIRSEHIVQVYDLIDFDGSPAIVMEYVDGKSLHELILENVQSEEFARMVAESVLTALRVAHRAGVVHRDIKPSNIMIDPNGIVKVADFGLASVGVETTLTLEGTVLGTPAYMSPEQVGGGLVDGRADFFSLGVTLIELVTGERLFQGETYAECLNKILSFKSESLDRFAATFSPPFLAFVRRLMMPRKTDRFSSAEEALKELTGRDPVMPERTAKSWLKPRVLVPFTLLAIVVTTFAVLRFWPAENAVSGTDSRNHSGPGSGDPEKADSLQLVASNISPERSLSTRDFKQPSPAETPVVRGVPDSGSLQITCTPWAKVFLGSEYIGTTPMAGTLKVRAGVHTLTFNNPSFPPLVRTVAVKAGIQTRVEANFLEHVGYLLVVSQPWAEIYVDDQYRETTPLGQPLIVTAGNRKIRLHNPSFEDIVTTVVVGTHDTVKIVKSFTSK